MRLVIECDKNANLESIVQKLFEKTDLQSSISYNQIALVDKTPCELNLKDACKIYVDHNISCIVREAEFDLKKAKDRLHIVEGLLKALEDIDNIIALIKKSDNSSAAKDNLMNKYEFTEVQAKAILAMRLSSLAHLEKVEIENEKADLEKNIKELDMLISNDLLQIKELRARLSSIVNKYGDDRRTELTHIEIKKTKEEKPVEEIIPEDVVVVTTKSGLIKRIPADSFKPTKRGKVGTKNIDDVILDIVKTNTVDKMIFFTTKGKMYQLSVEKIGAGTATSKGSHISTFVKMDDDETVIAATSMNRVNPKKYIIFTTKNGMIKKSCISEYMGSHRNGILALNVKESDEVISIDFADEENMMLVTKNGMSIQVETKDINPVGRVAMGVKGIKLDDNDEVVESLIVKDKGYIIIVSSDGLGKRVKIGDFPIQGRNGKGVTVYKGEVAGAAFIENVESETILITGNYSNLCILAKDFPEVSRAAAGNITIKNNKVINITKL